MLPAACGARLIPGSSFHCTLVLGGSRSGKSRFAEQLLTAEPTPWIYIATAQALDDEMHERIAVHQARRPSGWRTIEAPVDLPDALLQQFDRPVLVDCLTLWLTNLMLGGHNIEAATSALEDVLTTRSVTTVLVANEVGLGLVPETPLGRAFRDAAGLLNQRIAARARHVTFMVAGLPLQMK